MKGMLTIGVPVESLVGEKRVALVPDDVAKLAENDFQLLIEKGAGVAAGFADAAYKESGTVKLVTKEKAWGADLVLHVRPPTAGQIGMMKKGATLLSHIFANNNMPLVKLLEKSGINTLAMELMPRITRAQAMDSLSSQATVSGYWSVLHAAASCPIFFPMITYAAGTIRPAKMLVIGVGVAGLQAIAVARRLGAIVEAFDVRPETHEQILSLGAKPVSLGFDASSEGGYARELTKEEQAQVTDALTRSLIKADVVITTAGVPGKPSPRIVTKSQVEVMHSGSLIVDMVAENGGNCVLTKPGKTINHKGVMISGPVNIPSNMPLHASQMYSRNIMGMIALLIQNGEVVIDTNDAIIAGCLLTLDGAPVHPLLQSLQTKKTRASVKKSSTTKKAAAKKSSASGKSGKSSRSLAAG